MELMAQVLLFNTYKSVYTTRISKKEDSDTLLFNTYKRIYTTSGIEKQNQDV